MDVKIVKIPLIVPFDDAAIERLCHQYFEEYPCYFCKSTNSELIVSDNPPEKSKSIGMYCLNCGCSENMGEISLRIGNLEQIEIRIWKMLPDGGPENRWEEI